MKHTLRASVKTVHWGYYDAGLEPVLKVRSGDTIEVYTVSGSPTVIELLGIGDQIPYELKEIHEKVGARGPGPHILLGPIHVDGASTDDALEITLLEIEPWVDFGYNLFFPGGGSIPQDFPYLRAKCIQIDQERVSGLFSENLRMPLRPFFGELGVAPAPYLGKITSSIPGPHGGNLDNKELVASTKVYLPIHNAGALFSIGDGHSCQGDGEVDISALETCMKGLIRLKVLKGVQIKWPMAESDAHFILMGFHPDLYEAFKLALRNTIEFLVTKGFTKDNAYMFCSLCVDFRITQVVNGVKGIHAMVPKELVPGRTDSMI